MKIFTYKIDDKFMKAIRWHFGEAKYIDVSKRYQDILALCTDIVVIHVDACEPEVLDTIKEYEAETKDEDDTQYIYLTSEELQCLSKEIDTLLEN